MRPLLAASAGGGRGRRPVRALRGGGEWLRPSRDAAAPDTALRRNRNARARSSPSSSSLFDQATKWVVTYRSSCRPGTRSSCCPSSICAGSRIPASRSACSQRRQRARPLAAGRLTAAIADLRRLLAVAREAPRRSARARPGPRRRARQHRRSRAARLCRRFRRPAFRRVAALFGLQCRRRGDYHRRAAFACPRAPDARWQGEEEGKSDHAYRPPRSWPCPAALLLAGCAGGGLFGRGGPDEFAVARNQPLVVPPDFALTPPRPGEADAGGNDPRGQALQALFGGPQPRSAVETIAAADRPAPTAPRSAPARSPAIRRPRW